MVKKVEFIDYMTCILAYGATTGALVNNKYEWLCYLVQVAYGRAWVRWFSLHMVEYGLDGSGLQAAYGRVRVRLQVPTPLQTLSSVIYS
ncbi:hypothetical protein Hanom_Chr01g00029871 [Helianthus anomalus]